MKTCLIITCSNTFFWQGDFRKMFWGDSFEDLRQSYPNSEIIQYDCAGSTSGICGYDFDIYEETNTEIIGIPTTVNYYFVNDSLVRGGYRFHNSGSENFDKVQEILYEKYPENLYYWSNDTYDDIGQEQWDMLRTMRSEKTTIRHYMGRGFHSLIYSNKRYIEYILEKRNEIRKKYLKDF